MQERIVGWLIIICMILNATMDIYLGLIKSERTEQLKPRYNETDIVRGIIWLVVAIILYFI